MIDSPAKEKLDIFGVDQICLLLADCKTMTEIASIVGVSKGTFISWVADSADRSARVKSARALAATYWEEKATETIEQSKDELDLKRARELAHHYRWRASKIAPKEYGDRVQTEHSGSIQINDMSDEELERRIKAINQG